MDQVLAQDAVPFSKPPDPSYPAVSSEVLDKEITCSKANVVLFN